MKRHMLTYGFIIISLFVLSFILTTTSSSKAEVSDFLGNVWYGCEDSIAPENWQLRITIIKGTNQATHTMPYRAFYNGTAYWGTGWYRINAKHYLNGETQISEGSIYFYYNGTPGVYRDITVNYFSGEGRD